MILVLQCTLGILMCVISPIRVASHRSKHLLARAEVIASSVVARLVTHRWQALTKVNGS